MKELIIIVVFVTTILVIDLFRAYDDTDNVSEGIRSGLQLYTDHLTGCQYIKGSFFAELTPRVNGLGQHVGCYIQGDK